MIAVIVGTRPEIIKMAPVIRKLKEQGLLFSLLHTNQHYSRELDADIIEDLKLDLPNYNFGIGSLQHAAQTGRAMEAIEKVLVEQRPSFVLVHGDTNSTLAGAVAAKKLNILVGHVESGLRSFDQKMPEEINRILVDRISDIHFAPTEGAKKNLLMDGFTGETIVVTGNTVVDALNDHIELADSSDILKKLKLEPEEYIFLTAHRQENVDSKERLADLIKLVNHAAAKLGKKVIFPIHPRTQKRLEQFSLQFGNAVTLIPPARYIETLALIKNSSLVLTDSGGIQEEAYVLKRPLVTLRDSTERPETLTANFIIGNDIVKFDKAIAAYEIGLPTWEQVFGKGNASEIIVESIKKHLEL